MADLPPKPTYYERLKQANARGEKNSPRTQGVPACRPRRSKRLPRCRTTFCSIPASCLPSVARTSPALSTSARADISRSRLDGCSIPRVRCCWCSRATNTSPRWSPTWRARACAPLARPTRRPPPRPAVGRLLRQRIPGVDRRQPAAGRRLRRRERAGQLAGLVRLRITRAARGLLKAVPPRIPRRRRQAGRSKRIVRAVHADLVRVGRRNALRCRS